jgi:hypothetical protein
MAEGGPDVEGGAHLLFPAHFVGIVLNPPSVDGEKPGR